MYISDYNDFWIGCYPRDERFVQEAQNILSEKILDAYRKRLGNMSVLDTYLYKDLWMMHWESYKRLLPYLRYQCRLENRHAIWKERHSHQLPEWISEQRRSNWNIHPSDVAQMIINQYMSVILREYEQRLDSVATLIQKVKDRQSQTTGDLVKRYEVFRQ